MASSKDCSFLPPPPHFNTRNFFEIIANSFRCSLYNID